MARYSDINTRFGVDSNVLIVTDHDAVQQSIQAMLRSTAKSRFMRPNFESPLWNLLYSGISAQTAMDIMIAIEDMLATREPRAEMVISESTITPDRANKVYRISLRYRLTETGEEGTLQTVLQGAG